MDLIRGPIQEFSFGDGMVAQNVAFCSQFQMPPFLTSLRLDMFQIVSKQVSSCLFNKVSDCMPWSFIRGILSALIPPFPRNNFDWECVSHSDCYSCESSQMNPFPQMSAGEVVSNLLPRSHSTQVAHRKVQGLHFKDMICRIRMKKRVIKYFHDLRFTTYMFYKLDKVKF